MASHNPSPGFRDHPEHRITVAPLGKHVTVRSDGKVIASSDGALLLKEHTYPGVIQGYRIWTFSANRKANRSESGREQMLRDSVFVPHMRLPWGVIYIPFADIDFSHLSPTGTHTHCPFKGDASYWSVKDGARDAMWAYQHPYDEMSGIRDHGAFYPDRVAIETAER